MIRKKTGVFLILLISFAGVLFAQRSSQLKINEVMIKNTNNFHDEYGIESPWIEIFNSAYGTVDIGGCYLTNDASDLTKYMIPKGDIRTKIKARQHILFWADNVSSRGTFHLNFNLDTTKINHILLINADGKEIIDSISLVWNKKPLTSFGRCTDGADFVQNPQTGQKESAWKILHIVTPGTSNLILTGKEHQQSLISQYPDGVGNTIKSTSATNEKLKKEDSPGVGVSLIGMLVVMFALILLYSMFRIMSNLSILLKRRHLMRNLGIKSRETADEMAKNSGEVYAAIAMALYELDNDEHDWEDTKLTIKKVAKTYSPWSSKIYGLREIPSKR